MCTTLKISFGCALGRRRVDVTAKQLTESAADEPIPQASASSSLRKLSKLSQGTIETEHEAEMEWRTCWSGGQPSTWRGIPSAHQTKTNNVDTFSFEKHRMTS